MWDVNVRIIFNFTYQTTSETACEYYQDTLQLYSQNL